MGFIPLKFLQVGKLKKVFDLAGHNVLLVVYFQGATSECV